METLLFLAVLAFAGGAFGAAVGALNAFAFTGFVVVAGEVLNVVQVNVGERWVDVTHDVGFGVVFGPHVAFAGGAAASAYAAKKRYPGLEGPWDYHPAKQITEGLGSRVDVLAVGGAFGVVGFAFAETSTALSLPYDPVAAGVVVSAFAHRVALGYSVVGVASLRLDGEVWLPYQSRATEVAALGAAVGALSGYLAYVTGSAFLGFGLSAMSLAFMCAGVPRIPVTHHVTLPASTGVLALAGASAGTVDPTSLEGVSPSMVLAAGVSFGVLGALMGEAAQRLLYQGAETHLDPPAASIVATTFVIAALAAADVLPSSAWIPLP